MLSGMFFFFIPCPPWSRLLFITKQRKEVRHREVCFSGSVILIKLQSTCRCWYFYSLENLGGISKWEEENLKWQRRRRRREENRCIDELWRGGEGKEGAGRTEVSSVRGNIHNHELLLLYNKRLNHVQLSTFPPLTSIRSSSMSSGSHSQPGPCNERQLIHRRITADGCRASQSYWLTHSAPSWLYIYTFSRPNFTRKVRKAIIPVFKPLALMDTRLTSHSPQLTHNGVHFCFWPFLVLQCKKKKVWLIHLFKSCPPQLRFRNDDAGFLTGRRIIF